VFETKPTGKRALLTNLDSAGKLSHQPFNIGKFSSVTKRTADDLALDSDDSVLSDASSVKPKRGKGKAAPKAKPAARGRAKTKKIREESDLSDYEDPEDGDFAMNSDEEEKQLKAALKQSMGGGSTSNNSRASSSKPVRGTGTKTGRKNNAAALRAAVARAAESESDHRCLYDAYERTGNNSRTGCTDFTGIIICRPIIW